MARFKIDIVLTDGREINSTVTADNQAAALERLMSTPQFVDFVADSEQGEAVSVENISISPVDEVPIDPTRYKLQASDEAGWYVVTDTENLFIVRFQEHRYNETAQIKQIQDFPLDAQKVATLLREVGEWLAEHHRDKIFPVKLKDELTGNVFDVTASTREELGQYLQQMRTSKGWSVRRFAEASELSPATVVNLESGKFTARMDVINKYIEVLGAKMIIIPG